MDMNVDETTVAGNMAGVLQCIKTFITQSGLPQDCINTSTCLFQEQENFFDNLEHLVSSLQGVLDRKTMNRKIKNEVVNVKPALDPELVQITASKNELDKRIAAFISQAQNLVDEQNIHEFAYDSKVNLEKEDNEQYGCARTNALYRRPANRMHMHVSRVENQEGPQMQIDSQGNWHASNIKPESTFGHKIPRGVQERFVNLENHVGIKSEKVPMDVYERLKKLEERVLELEATSPEYFESHQVSSERSRNPSRDENQFSLDEIDDRIRYLKQKLLKSDKLP
uniref:MAP3K12-binding inhibitory protein 1 n=1 Tax=Ciona intestinalis TaxID=7719 RepID=H2XKJ0_CIOIN|nr:MAP3K12-binding inhibitory protein 1 [Ciona intestinalis]|eukprot:XP_002125989.1 MAP3K12-binding inhibitory protein 1 [Ciona intestinalis]